MKKQWKIGISYALAFALILGVGAGAATAQEKGTAKGGAAKLMELKPVKSKGDVAKLHEGDTVAVACSHCKQVWVSTVTKGGASGLIKFNEDDKVICPKCGSTEAFCCAGKEAKSDTH